MTVILTVWLGAAVAGVPGRRRPRATTPAPAVNLIAELMLGDHSDEPLPSGHEVLNRTCHDRVTRSSLAPCRAPGRTDVRTEDHPMEYARFEGESPEREDA
ncbi:hypothetical protein GCM10010116_01730 [Microbispora rosea subsp. aerata]|nr:hypothetical protein GCM10010116_01730 [Microbispora rosea subsp. aerata]GIH56425.1 hypothetical protein Mro02_33390 [Microbispora rosea subsp. aerata]GLJ84409.1 hypothetical protein GCM10017588_31370 [Microbispora rosea subsp. aerata]